MNLDGAPDNIFTCQAKGGVQASYSAIPLNLRNHRSACPTGPTLLMGTPALGNNMDKDVDPKVAIVKFGEENIGFFCPDRIEKWNKRSDAEKKAKLQ